MQRYLIKNIQIVNEGIIQTGDVLIDNQRIEKIAAGISIFQGGVVEINGEGKFLLPGVIDDQVHFREPGLTHKGSIFTESKAAVAGGVTSFMDMPNTQPPAFSLELLQEKYNIAAKESFANYSFYIGVNNLDASEALKANEFKNEICGFKIFLGSSTGNLLVDNPAVLEKIFSESEMLIATHCEDETIIKTNLNKYTSEGKILKPTDHPVIRNQDACYESSLFTIQLAQKFDSRLHILHISTAKELTLFSNMMPLTQKRITSEVCVHHLHFTADDYETCGYLLKCNPAIKAKENKEALWDALLDGRLDVIATDHAPHTLAEKGYARDANGKIIINPNAEYSHAHAGVPLVQHSLLLMLHYFKAGKISLEKIAEKMSHSVADCFQISQRGYIRESYFADLVMVDLNTPSGVNSNNLAYHCGWSPFEIYGGIDFHFPATIEKTFVNGNLVYENQGGSNHWFEPGNGEKLKFNRR